jgi:3-methyl-2-oxobutanoate hydroxymethyltransferase
MKGRGEPIAMLTAYDSVTAALLDEVGIDILLVGDSLGNVVLGYETTLRVTLADMIRHAGAVTRGSARALVVCDMPFGTATDPETALRNAVEVMQQSDVQAVKVEGGMAMVPIVKRLTSFGIPVMGHLGLTPQSVHQLGGYYMHGKNAHDARTLLEAAQALEQAGAFAVVLECLVPELAARITRSVSIPTIGIGSGPECDGQVLVINDLIGLNTRPAPSFARPRADVASTIKSAARAYLDEVKSPRPPTVSLSVVEKS